MIMIYSALFYPGSLERGDLIVRDNRFYPCKYSETFPVWMQYIRKHYPDEHIVLLADVASPVPIQPILDRYLKEPYDSYGLDVNPKFCPEPFYLIDGGSVTPRVHVRWMSKHTGRYFWAMQRNIVESLIMAYLNNHDWFWVDADAFLNTDILSIVKRVGADFAAPQIAHHQMTADSVCTFISAERLHALDSICNLPDYLHALLADGPTDLRMHSLQEGGLYKTFCYGRVMTLGNQIELSHLACYDHFIDFLRRNPLDTPEYRYLFEAIQYVDFSKMEGVEMVFHDMDFKAPKQTLDTFVPTVIG